MAFGESREIKKKPNSNDILGCVDSQEIFEMYLGGLPTKPISSPFREDKNPSFSLFYSNEHEMLMYKDFSTGEVGDCFNFVMKLFKISSKIETFNKIARDFKLTQFELGAGFNSKFTRKRKKGNGKKVRMNKPRVEIKINLAPWTHVHKNYMLLYGLTSRFANSCDVFPIRGYWIGDAYYQSDPVAFAYLEMKDGIKTFKIYQPYNAFKKKWVSGNDSSTWELWNMLPKKGNILVITSSRKDAMVIKSLYKSRDITSCSLQSEGVIPKLHVLDQLKSRFKQIYILYDNDFDNPRNPGRMAGIKLAKLSGFRQMEIPSKFKFKDISDFRRNKGKLQTKDLLKSLIIEARGTKRKLNINN